ncbi:hypothetical protein C7212DRAFT_367301 [Tuber magnatum]|uniref:N-acetyltransferase domain-containing protein n=1 Tax=Tuber magnatum TaxID=42249 RepID=A0A317SG82_9PEZI|nr:hypothetical protein C7212DRAFT_367301 [Tuber magnatum]
MANPNVTAPTPFFPLPLLPLPNTALTNAVMGKAKGTAKDWRGHVTVVTVAPDYRRLGLAKTMMDELERVQWQFRRPVRMWYLAYRTVVEYYSSSSCSGGGGGGGKVEGGGGDEDVYDMRKPMRRDKHQKSMLDHPSHNAPFHLIILSREQASSGLRAIRTAVKKRKEGFVYPTHPTVLYAKHAVVQEARTK